MENMAALYGVNPQEDVDVVVRADYPSQVVYILITFENSTAGWMPKWNRRSPSVATYNGAHLITPERSPAFIEVHEREKGWQVSPAEFDYHFSLESMSTIGMSKDCSEKRRGPGMTAPTRAKERIFLWKNRYWSLNSALLWLWLQRLPPGIERRLYRSTASRIHLGTILKERATPPYEANNVDNSTVISILGHSLRCLAPALAIDSFDVWMLIVLATPVRKVKVEKTEETLKQRGSPENYEAEDGHTDDQRAVRFAVYETQFPAYSWTSSAVFSPIQEKINMDIDVAKASVYRLLFKYHNPTTVPITATVEVAPKMTHTQDILQSEKVVFAPTSAPSVKESDRGRDTLRSESRKMDDWCEHETASISDE
ncbi:hypothetical protein TELCIR_13762 [Teladorsagia circumcincta]|uniref:Uncharacterized protein n=1 Tax=Teladorsagia circumcincta TaxID=45464 RepID=A0A2G9U342_TELCI|nr:hypothetical protein TELCIR_13762 [Teladorsagia circumcincta]